MNIAISGFLKLWSVIFVVVTTLVMVLKHETEARTSDEEDVLEDSSTHSVTEAYVLLWRIVHLPAILSLIAALMTIKVKCQYHIHIPRVNFPFSPRLRQDAHLPQLIR